MRSYDVKCEKHGVSHIYGSGDTSCPQCENELDKQENQSIAELKSALSASQSRVKRLEQALADVFALMDEGFLVRDISKDMDDGWAIKMIPFIQRLKKANEVLADVKKA